jgi:hypothetical protein
MTQAHRSNCLAALSSALAVALTGCGSKSESPTKANDTAAAIPAAAPLAMPAVGVDQIKRFNFIYDAGAPAHDKAVAAYRKQDWAGVRAHAEAALAKDPTHLGAQRLIAAALAQAGEPAAAVDPLVSALAADYLQYAPTLADDDLASFMRSSHGQAVKALAARIRDEYARRIASGLWLVGRRSPYRWPKELGVQPSTTRGELYAFDREARRFLRLTHTEHQVAGFVRSGAEVAILGFDKIDRPKPEPRPDPTLDPKPARGAAAPPVFARAWLQIYETTAWRPVTPRITLPPAREITLGYAAGDQLLVSTAQATGRWTVGDPVVSSVDRATGKLTQVATALPATRLVVSLDEGQLVRAPTGVVAAWTGDPPTSSSLAVHATAGQGQAIQIPESGSVSQASVAVSPTGSHVAFATAVDPCAKLAAPSLYVADARTRTYKHLLSARSRFPTRWLDSTLLAYQDGEGAIRMWDAATGREAMRIDERSGIALDVLSLAAAPLCKQAPPTVDPGSTGEDSLPPEEPPGTGSGAAGPVTAPQ